jgi:hypothetical protein
MTKIYTFMNVPCSYFQSNSIQQQPPAAAASSKILNRSVKRSSKERKNILERGKS